MRGLDLVKKYALERTVQQMAALLGRGSDKTLVRFCSLAGRLCPTEMHRRQVRWVKQAFQDGHPCTRLARRVFQDTNRNVRAHLVKNLLINNSWAGWRKRREVLRDEGWFPPTLMVISPSMRCNLRCYGCYAGSYSRADDLEYGVIDRVLTEAKDLGIYFVTVSGGEPFFREDLLDLYEKHSDMVFHVYTNGTLIDDEMADRIIELGNVYPSISVEGFKEQTDARRGEGVWDKVMAAMDRLRERGGMFGFSGTVVRNNAEIMCTPELIDLLVEKGCYWGWWFVYIPIGRKPALELMPTPEQRDRLREWTLEIRRTRPIFVADFWNDGPLTKGCMAGGKKYFHINNRGDVEPCVFSHFAVDNMHDKSLREALQSDFFKHISSQIPYVDNVLRPCMIIDNPWVLREAVEKHGAYDTDGGGHSLLCEIAPDLDDYAHRWAELADRAWAEGYEWAREGGFFGEPVPDSTIEQADSEQRERPGRGAVPTVGTHAGGGSDSRGS